MPRIAIVTEQLEGRVRIRVVAHDPELYGHRATLSLVQKVEVADSRAVHGEKSLLAVDFDVDSGEFVHEVADHTLDVFTYRGRQIDIELHAKVVVDDGFFWDTTLSKEITHELGHKPHIGGDANDLVNPRDLFNLSANVNALSLGRKCVTLAVLAFGFTFVAINSIVGCHDQAVNDVDAYVYGHDGVPPIVLALLGCGGVGVTTWYLLKWLLRGYTTIALGELPRRISRSTTIPIGQLVLGRPRVDLWSPRIRVVAWNTEHGQYRRGSGTQERTVSFSEPVRAVVLYDARVERIPPGEEYAQHFEGEIAFAKMFDVLFPPSMATPSHGLGVAWEVQFLHDDFVDFEFSGSKALLNERDFHVAPASSDSDPKPPPTRSRKRRRRRRT